MANPNAIVAGVSRLSSPDGAEVRELLAAVPNGLRVEFDNGRHALLSPVDPSSAVYAEVLDELRRMMISAYIEVDPATNLVTRVLVPSTVRISGIVGVPEGGLDVELEVSQARHRLQPNNPDYAELETALRQAMQKGSFVVVTENDAHEIIDVRPASNPLLPEVSEAAATSPAILDEALRAVTPQRAQQLFNMMGAQSCNPVTVPAPCIPFLYPDDGCWERAHQMCRIMIAAGEQPSKIWIYGNLHVSTRNNPNCAVSWGWHVAPTLQVTASGGTQPMAVDPSLFTQPVPVQQWNAVQGDPGATLAPSDASVFHRSKTAVVQYDPTYAQTAQVLSTYRLRLKIRSTGPAGPPPYRNCP